MGEVRREKRSNQGGAEHYAGRIRRSVLRSQSVNDQEGPDNMNRNELIGKLSTETPFSRAEIELASPAFDDDVAFEKFILSVAPNGLTVSEALRVLEHERRASG